MKKRGKLLRSKNEKANESRQLHFGLFVKKKLGRRDEFILLFVSKRWRNNLCFEQTLELIWLHEKSWIMLCCCGSLSTSLLVSISRIFVAQNNRNVAVQREINCWMITFMQCCWVFRAISSRACSLKNFTSSQRFESDSPTPVSV